MSNFLKSKEPEIPPAATGTKQTIQARHGTATFVPKGHTLKIINTYGRQVVDTWAFALHAPPTQEEWDEDNQDGNEIKEEDETAEENKEQSGDSSQVLVEAQTPTPPKEEENKSENAEDSKEGAEEKAEEPKTPVKEDAENKDEGAEGTEKNEGEQSPAEQTRRSWASYVPSIRKQPEDGKPKEATPEKAPASASKGWSSYIPSVPSVRGTKKPDDGKPKEQKSWSSYLSAGQGFNSYLPNSGSISSFAALHQRDPTKSVAEQMYDFSKTPVGAAGISVASGSGYASSIYAAYSAYTKTAGDSAGQPGMEFLSMPHTRASTQHLSPQVGDLLVSNLRAPILSLIEDTSPGAHDTLIAACDPLRYRELGVKKWEEHGSCAENLVLALSELNARVGLKGRKAIGADVTVNAVPAPLNLFMNIPWTEEGGLSFEPPRGKRGDYVRFRAERDVVVVMSACPQDVLEINGGKPMVAHFVVESPSEEDKKIADARTADAQRIIEKARLRTGEEKKKPAPARQSSSASNAGKPVPVRQPSASSSRPPATARQSSAASRPSRPAVARQPSSNRPPPPKLTRGSVSRGSSSQMSVPRKETQRVEPSEPSPPPTPAKKKPRKLERRTSAAPAARRG
ncbi:hypothetical protein BT63DRAFT_475096 [Microthyrium microscopicum]|uniref:DUF1989 domain-containing protein n=1 Tax=Microthyrium microscopicum TaxID=703497 RepID=A0A6A6UTN4_9PEZI|nr:hypothetical protein BT63DRAFT_475096 [Microthyrium microscopicum]